MYMPDLHITTTFPPEIIAKIPKRKKKSARIHLQPCASIAPIQEWLKIAVFEKQVAGIEPVSPAWEAGVLPMNYTCMSDLRLV